MGAGTTNTPTNQVTGGILGGLVDSFALIGDTNRDIDNLAVLISESLNEQHKQGLTLDGKQGEKYVRNFRNDCKSWKSKQVNCFCVKLL